MRLNELELRLKEALARPAPASSDFDLNKDFTPPPGRKLRPAAVLIPLIEGMDGVEVVLTKRSSRLKHHPGQIAFPGGKVDPTDATPEAAAHREAWEEIGLPIGAARVIGALPTHETVTSFTMTSFVGAVETPFVPKPEVGEVAEVFSVPFEHVINPARFRVERRRWQGRWRHYYTIPFGPYYIWGATARILRSMSELMQNAR
ncbi:NUDIX hydrolase [Tropicimonas sp. S265A]|uniref:NUDIX hydrolase n=1 Tax=Tropicimonas sp. S265A TaxID=3415134 RepID=UPI003C7C28ED